MPVPVAVQADPSRMVLRDTPQEKEPEEELKRLALKKAPPWVISCLLHMLLLIILGLWYITADPTKTGIFLDVSSPEMGEQLLDDSLSLSSDDLSIETAIVPPSELQAVEDPFASSKPEPTELALIGAKPMVNLDAPTINLALMGREPGTKEALLGKYGGNGESESAVKLGLAWLARYQRKDGSWSLKGPYRSGALNRRDLPESATAMALLAFQGAGNTHQRGEFQQQVAKGIKALLRMQGGNGNFFQQGDSNNWFYSHAQCTMAVCELYGMTKDEELRRPAELAIQFLIESQDPQLGGWRYLPRSDSDTSVTGWAVMAFQSARMAGLLVPSPVLAKIGEYLDQATPDGSQYGYQIATEPTLTMTADALLCRQYLGWRRDDPRLIAGADVVLKYLPRYEERDVYYWYYGTQMMHHMEGKYWPAWHAALRDMLVEHQEKSGAEKGSWDPKGEHPDRWANLGQGGRLYTTCLSLYMLEVYYRHLPIYGVRK
ncbi:MAG TPA: prenyltransferase/squalene oxidase repeat-containing protein [Pirellulales bacterium]|nr:prenyltransferase/squalene oxidase repeat-containing protein [Pirellulales bacterium]